MYPIIITLLQSLATSKERDHHVSPVKHRIHSAQSTSANRQLRLESNNSSECLDDARQVNENAIGRHLRAGPRPSDSLKHNMQNDAGIEVIAQAEGASWDVSLDLVFQ